ncbi:endonuclease MutS2 [Aurantibacillus circumpalustris]|uniref:endonuclease MutS2 n=1 Tax=Aurantibacillus circumpalustris TaxID=3036359 RepID=UPI00295A7F64|nr:MutS2/Smr-associated SH3 domain-containing protein [Aurantibacillus circumpalustris]
MIEKKHLELLQFDKVKNLVQQRCHSKQAKTLCEEIFPKSNSKDILTELNQTNELKLVIAAQGYFPSVEHEDISVELNYLALDGALLHESQLLSVLKTVEVCNTLIRFLKGKKASLPFLFELVKDLEVFDFVVDEINRIIDSEAQVKNNASSELSRIRKLVVEKRRESDKRFYNYINELRKHGFLRENEESFFNGRRTLAVLVEHKSDVPGFVHSKSESGKTIFIEPTVTIGVNNDVAELEIDENREISRILRELCAKLNPFSQSLKNAFQFLIYMDFVKAKSEFAVDLKACLPEIKEGFNLSAREAYHPLLYIQNKRLGKPTIPMSLDLNGKDRIIVISGPNAGGKTISLKTIGLLQLMLQSGLLIPVKETSTYCFFEKILIDIGDTQSIENELSTYSAKLKSMTSILNEINEASLVLMDEFGSGTDPELGSAIAESVLENLVNSKTRGVITSHFGDVKLLAEKLNGAINASMLFNIETLEPKYILSIGEPGSSYTFEVAERIGFPIHLINRAKEKVDKDKLKLNRLLADVQDQKTKLAEQAQRLEHEEFLKKIAKEKYHTLFTNWEEKINKERERKIELVRLADFGQKYLRLMDDWNKKQDKKVIIKRFIDGITAETKKQEELRKQNKLSNFAEKKIARIKPVLKVGSKVKVLNGNEVGVVEEIRDEKVFIKFGLMKMTVGMENLVLAEE